MKKIIETTHEITLSRSELEHIKIALELYFYTKRATDSEVDKILFELALRKIPSKIRSLDGDPLGIDL